MPHAARSSTLPVVGRAAERATLRAALDAARAGTGAVVLVTGPAGIGKTRLVEALAEDAAADGVPVAWGRCPAEQGVPPLWPLRRVLAARSVPLATASGPEAGATPEDTAAGRLALSAAVVDALVAAAEPEALVVVLEDLHWADAASLDVLRQLAADVRRSRLLVVASARDSAPSPLLDLVPLAGVQLLALEPLSMAGVAAWLSTSAGRAVAPAAVALVHQRSGGNPLYVRTLVRVLGDELLDGEPVAADVARRLSASSELRHLVAAVLRPLAEPVRTLLGVASVLGEEVDAELLAAVLDVARQDVGPALAAADAAGLLAAVPGAPGRLRFVHALVRDGVRADLPERDRLRWHRRAAQVLEQRAEPHGAGEVAFHWLQGAATVEELGKAVSWARTAAEQSAAVAPEEAARLLAAALSCADRAGADDALRAALLVELAAAEYRAGRMSESLQHCRWAADAAERAGDPELLAAAALVLRGVGHPATAAVIEELCARALRGHELLAATRARLLAQRSLAVAELGRWAPAAEGAREALAAAEACGDPKAVLAAVHARVDTLDCLAPPAERRALADRALEVAPAAGQPLARLWALLWRLDAAHQDGDPVAVEQETARVEAFVADVRLPLARWHLLRVRAARAALAGRLDEARAADAEAEALARQLQDPAALGMSSAFRLCVAQLTGDPRDLGEDWFERLRGAPDIPILDACRAVALLLAGRPEEARLPYARVMDDVRGLPRDGRWRGTVEALVEAAVRLRDRTGAAALHEVLLPAGRWSGGPGSGNVWSGGSLWRQVGRAGALAGRADAAASLERALVADVALGARAVAAHVRLELAEVVATHDPARAAALAAEAAVEARRTGMPDLLRRADALLTSTAAARPDPLTAREREVAGLVAESLSNRAIAERLVLSERTVESHVRNVLAKLGFTRRTDVVRWVLEAGERAG